MGEKSEQKKRMILDRARKVFAEKGFRDVTMKDVVEASEISRGGLYLYYNNTQEILAEILEEEKKTPEEIFPQGVKDGMAASEVMALFFKEQKMELLKKTENLSAAVYEFFFAHKPKVKKTNLLRQRFKDSVAVLEKIIEAGVEDQEFTCDDPRGAARNIMYVIEGLRITAQTVGITEKTIDEELMYIMQGLLIEK